MMCIIRSENVVGERQEKGGVIARDGMRHEAGQGDQGLPLTAILCGRFVFPG